MDPRDATPAAAIGFSNGTGSANRRRSVWHVLALLLAGAVTWLVFAAYRQPDFILDFAGVRLC